jgi:alpha-galactosidase
LGYFPTHTDRHVCEFFPYFLRKETGYGSKYGQDLWDTDVWVSSKEERTTRLTSLARGEAPLGDLTRPSGGDIIPVIEAMIEDSGREFVVNQPNDGYAHNLPTEAVVEMNAIIDSRGITPAGKCPAPRSLLGIILYRINQQEMVVRSFLENDRDMALQALILDPLTRSIEDAEKMFDELLAVNRGYLPGFS